MVLIIASFNPGGANLPTYFGGGQHVLSTDQTSIVSLLIVWRNAKQAHSEKAKYMISSNLNFDVMGGYE